LKLVSLYLAFFHFEDLAFLKLQMATFGLFNFYGSGNPGISIRQQEADGKPSNWKGLTQTMIRKSLTYTTECVTDLDKCSEMIFLGRF